MLQFGARCCNIVRLWQWDIEAAVVVATCCNIVRLRQDVEAADAAKKEAIKIDADLKQACAPQPCSNQDRGALVHRVRRLFRMKRTTQKIRSP